MIEKPDGEDLKKRKVGGGVGWRKDEMKVVLKKKRLGGSRSVRALSRVDSPPGRNAQRKRGEY
ncbi:hypothetical protein N7495_000708 [Penicillium taxi]|uniref:uncharacterized protein n=1 Tax=Penicillium taxi TaxID=168475 RepID=UPI002545B8ED|nr:uncharacterized protein N7495_000708 [Penicillium taxi]KAJ5908026.1 hypothetical protein N7495_000708 [Penicillium taxi]